MRISLKAARINKGLLQTDVAIKLDVDRKTVGSWETGKTKPSVKYIEPLCAILGVSYDDIEWNS